MGTIVLASASDHAALDQFDAIVNEIAPSFGIEPNLCKAHIEYESAGNPNIVGSSGRGLGLGQIDFGTYQDATGKWWYSSVHGKTDEVFDPRINIEIMCRDFLLPLRNAFPAILAARIAGYNVGIDRIAAALDAGVGLTTLTTDPFYIRNVQRAFEWFDMRSATSTA